jgi:transcriptional regulator with XRE-family HTH domain
VVRKGSAKVTLSDVAGRAGVSVTTASFVLSGRRDMRISEGTQERVHQAARELIELLPMPYRARESISRPSSARRRQQRGA